ncbi:hypothetical protein SSPO_000400 [Streptomyces antimycoticus]|uniref:Uncharacterized protein n=1 Tax=Streptomyces antimycoticus TaxID=68175 RepID=A0A499UBF4_9ACTN|nr:hypothetical protein SSPO_000400 [Streptomyces antimycoticus]
MTGEARRALPAPRALFLDFDGVVCDTERAARRSWQELYARSRLALPTRVWTRMAGSSVGAGVARADLTARRGFPLTPGELAWRAGRKAELADREPLCPGVDALVRAAETLGCLSRWSPAAPPPGCATTSPVSVSSAVWPSR